MNFGLLLASLSVGFGSLRANPLRTVLSALGVIIGVGAMISVLSLSDGVEREVRAQLGRDGRLQSVVVAPRTEDVVDGQAIPRATFPVFTAADARALGRAVGPMGEVFLAVSGPGLVTADGDPRPPRAALVAGTLANGAARRGLALTAGRFFTDAEVDAGARVIVLSRALAAALARGGEAPAALVGRRLRVQGAPWQVVGVLADAAGAAPAAPGRPLAAYVPVSAAAAAMVPDARPRAPAFVVRARRVEDLPAVRGRAERWLAARGPAWRAGVRVDGYDDESARTRDGIVMFKLLMGAITGVSLVVGGVGIMNVLLASVTERTREIGVRKAAGARDRDVLAQFLAESVVIAGLGGVLGTALGVGVSVAVAAAMRARTAAAVHAGFSTSTLLVAVAAPLVVGLAFGTYPALRAARLSPIDAIRHE